ncbi:30S ribosomal protein S4 [Candidatus Tremblaya princeps]|uniref:Small ribosomal subunit protein uS4 n=1 Tax=Tremblaya princeps TaxID=189385 RepID=A0A143WNM6_TREPR|nr:30S ribosomal protein S4 [Candidatus Tremblaya princeps]
MARYIGPRQRLSRREGFDLLLKSGARAFDSKCKSAARPGQSQRRQGHRPSSYCAQFRGKQRIKRYYGVLERQFAAYVRRAAKVPGHAGCRLLQALESRLDNVVYRMGFATTRPSARQLVSHRHVAVNAAVVRTPSYTVRAGDVVSVRGQHGMPAAHPTVRGCPYAWLHVRADLAEGVFRRAPTVAELPHGLQTERVSELYTC